MKCFKSLFWAMKVLSRQPKPIIMDKWYVETRGRGDQTQYLIKCNRKGCENTRIVSRRDALWCGENCRQRENRDRQKARKILKFFRPLFQLRNSCNSKINKHL